MITKKENSIRELLHHIEVAVGYLAYLQTMLDTKIKEQIKFKSKGDSMTYYCPKCGSNLVVDYDSEAEQNYYFCKDYPTCDYATYDTPHTENIHRNYNYE